MNEPIPIILAQTCRNQIRELAAQLDRTGEVLVVGEMHDIEATARASIMRAARAILLVSDDSKAASDVSSLMQLVRVPIVVITRTTSAAVAAMAAGALEALPLDTPLHRLVESLKLMSSLRVVKRVAVAARPVETAPAPPLPYQEPAPEGARLVAIGASTGGPAALIEVLGQLPANFPAAIVLAQHMPDDYDSPFARWLSEVTRLDAKVCEDGEPLRAGKVYIPRGGCDLVIGPSGLLLNAVPSGKGPVPSADRLLVSASKLTGFALFGVVLTGMGRDGMVGLKAMRQAGAVTLAQDTASSVVSSMPDAAIEHGAARTALPPAHIALQLLAWAGATGANGRE